VITQKQNMPNLAPMLLYVDMIKTLRSSSTVSRTRGRIDNAGLGRKQVEFGVVLGQISRYADMECQWQTAGWRAKEHRLLFHSEL
jgi:hypothetical protein